MREREGGGERGGRERGRGEGETDRQTDRERDRDRQTDRQRPRDKDRERFCLHAIGITTFGELHSICRLPVFELRKRKKKKEKERDRDRETERKKEKEQKKGKLTQRWQLKATHADTSLTTAQRGTQKGNLKSASKRSAIFHTPLSCALHTFCLGREP